MTLWKKRGKRNYEKTSKECCGWKNNKTKEIAMKKRRKNDAV